MKQARSQFDNIKNDGANAIATNEATVDAAFDDKNNDAPANYAAVT